MNKVIMKTANFNTIWNICTEAKNKSKLISIIGYPGAGKTTAFLRFVEDNESVFYVRVTGSMTAKQFYTKVLNALGIEGRNFGMNLYDLITKVSITLNRDLTRKLLIIDEAGKIKRHFLEFIHELRDNTSSHTGIILGGPEYFHENMKTWSNKGIVGIPELYRRINHWEVLDRPTPDEVSALCKVYGVEDPDVIQEVIKKALNYSIVENMVDEHLIGQEKVKK